MRLDVRLFKFIQVKKSTDYFLRDTSEEDKALAKLCLELVQFETDNTFIMFRDKYWLYGGEEPVDKKGLTIGGFESAGFADLVAAWLIEEIEDLFDGSILNEMYRDDGINITKGHQSINEIQLISVDLTNTSQSSIDELTESKYL